MIPLVSAAVIYTPHTTLLSHVYILSGQILPQGAIHQVPVSPPLEYPLHSLSPYYLAYSLSNSILSPTE